MSKLEILQKAAVGLKNGVKTTAWGQIPAVQRKQLERAAKKGMLDDLIEELNKQLAPKIQTAKKVDLKKLTTADDEDDDEEMISKLSFDDELKLHLKETEKELDELEEKFKASPTRENGENLIDRIWSYSDQYKDVYGIRPHIIIHEIYNRCSGLEEIAQSYTPVYDEK